MDKTLHVTVPECSNCSAILVGPYCSHCGQHAHESARSVSALFHDAWHSATHLDSRLWQSLYILLFKPGKLTTEYFAERRARYLPPVRLYLALSVLFFAFGLATPAKHPVLPHVAPHGATAPDKAAAEAAAEAGKTDAAHKQSRNSFFEVSSCGAINTSPAWLQNTLRQSCMRDPENYEASVKQEFMANIPKMMFVFVPMMALVMMILYWRPRRYYVEHLVFFLHSHATIFLLLLIYALFSWIEARLAWSSSAAWLIAIIGVYSAWYVYRAMRVYYGQGRLLTFTKFCAVGFTYLIGFCITLLVTLLVSAIIA